MRERFLASSAADWGVSLRAARWIFWLPALVSAALLGTPFLYGALGSEGQWLVRRAFGLVVREDGPLEWAQVACFAAGGLAACSLAARLHRCGAAGQGALVAVLALGLFVVVGEELSWGQRIFDARTPGWLAAVNEQDELNLHNVAGVRAWLDAPRMVLAAWGIFAGLSGWRRAGAAPLFLVPSFAVMLAYDVLRETVWSEPGFFLRLARYGEWPELCFAFGVGATLVLTRRRLARAGKRPLALEPARGVRDDRAA